MVRKYLKLGVMIMATSSLVNCSLNDIVGLPRISIEKNFGTGKIAEILEEKEVWTGGHAIYTNESNRSRGKKTDDDIYKLLLDRVSDNESDMNESDMNESDMNESEMNIEDYLNNSNLGVYCYNNLCIYHGYYITSLENGPDHFPSGERIDRYDIYISFKPRDFESSYTASIVSKRIL